MSAVFAMGLFKKKAADTETERRERSHKATARGKE